MKLLWSIAVLGTALLAVSWALNVPSDAADEISREYLKYLETGVRSERLVELGDQLRGAHSVKDIFTKSLVDVSAADQYFVCTLCRATVNVFSNTFTSPDGELNGPNRDENARRVMLDICEFFSVATPEVCGGGFDLNWPIMDYILNETIAESRSICGMLPIPICQVQQQEYNFSLPIVGELPTESKSDLPARSDAERRILHLTDIHYDPEYLPGGQADCNEPLCCRRPISGGSSAPAGYWSDYRDCDTPRHLIVNAFAHIRDNQKFDWIYHTGDVPPHNVWSTTRQGNIAMLSEIDELLAEYFPNTPIYSCLGNHEPHPTNVFGSNEVPAELSVDWLYEHVWSLWSKWLPSDARQTVLRGGYYTLSPSAGHRIVALNSMDCYLFNWWLYYNGSIVLEQLQWLHDTLLAAEAAGEYVHILTHIPSGDADCWTVWSREYNRLLARFSPIITGIFNGHTHKDEMNVHYTDAGLAVAVSWNGGSLTTYSDMNPNYRIYNVDPDKWLVVDHATWIFNLTAANVEGASPVWFEEYAFSKEFTSDTSPAGLDRLLLKMAQQPQLLRKFWRYKFTSADPPLLEWGCDSSCLNRTICRLATSNYQDKRRCRELQAILQENLDNEPPEDDGAAILSAQSLGSLLLMLLALRYLL